MPAIHNYECPDCGCFFEAFFEFMDDAEETHPCVKCIGDAKRVITSPFFKMGKDGTSAGGRSPKLKDKKFAEEFTEYHFAHTKRRMETSGKRHYAAYDYNPENDKGERKARRMSQEELNKKAKNAQEQTIEAYKRAGKLDELGKKK